MKKLIENIINSSCIKIIDFALPLLIIPYVISKIGMSAFGVFSVCLTLANFIITFNDFGLNTILSKKVAQNEEKNTHQQLVCLHTNIKIRLYLLILLIIIPLPILVPQFPLQLIICFAIGIFFETISPLAYFQGIQQLRFALVIQATCRILSSILIFLLISDPSDEITYAALHNLSYVINSIILLLFLKNKFGIKITLINIPSIQFKKTLQESWEIYSYRLLGSIINPLVSSFISYFYGTSVVTVYSISQRVCSSVSRIYEPISNVMFPHISKIVTIDLARFKKHCFIYLALLLSTSLIIIFITVYFQDTIHIYLANRTFTYEEKAIYLFTILMILTSVANYFICHVIIALNNSKIIIMNVGLSLLFFTIALIYISIFNSPAFSVPLSLFLSDAFLTLTLFITTLSLLKTRHHQVVTS
ncbi:oligosaccharide flippase family protein [Enterobacter chuandaensis]|uniref:oligosaccharide flippase family protein n=1 Tax=Enterobacter chuandaensis TaxID=2497875 RepID=UPI00300CCE4D